MAITSFETLTSLVDFLDNAKNYEVYNVVGRQVVDTTLDDKTVLVTEIAFYTNFGTLFHTSKNKYKTNTTMPPIAKKETELLEDKEKLFEKLSEKFNVYSAPVSFEKRTGSLIVGDTIDTTKKDAVRTTA